MADMPKVLLIDDETEATKIFSRFLETAGIDTETAASGQKGLQKAFASRPDVVILDIMMPDMTGYEVCRRLRQDPRTTRTPILMLTARGQMVDQQMSFRVGADAYMAKPVRRSELVEAVEELLQDKSGDQAPLGHQTLVLRLREDAGATFLATNLALALAKEEERLTVVTDLVFEGGRVGNALGLGTKSSWLGLLNEYGLHEAGLAPFLVRHKSGLFALPATPPPEGVAQPRAATVRLLLQILRMWFDYLILDTPLDLRHAASVLLESQIVLLLLTPDPKTLQAAEATLAALKQHGLNPSQIWPVLNMFKPEDYSLRNQISESLGLPIAASLFWAPGIIAQAKQSGQPLFLAQPQSEMALVIQSLAANITESAARWAAEGTTA
jgi:CheY-like chemotaxis protein/MinD-like ATPase involved in chromosome partitioning or flagellar assembly